MEWVCDVFAASPGQKLESNEKVQRRIKTSQNTGIVGVYRNSLFINDNSVFRFDSYSVSDSNYSQEKSKTKGQELLRAQDSQGELLFKAKSDYTLIGIYTKFEQNIWKKESELVSSKNENVKNQNYILSSAIICTLADKSLTQKEEQEEQRKLDEMGKRRKESIEEEAKRRLAAWKKRQREDKERLDREFKVRRAKNRVNWDFRQVLNRVLLQVSGGEITMAERDAIVENARVIRDEKIERIESGDLDSDVPSTDREQTDEGDLSSYEKRYGNHQDYEPNIDKRLRERFKKRGWGSYP